MQSKRNKIQLDLNVMVQLAQKLAYALQQVAVVVEALLTVALVARQCVLAAALLADFFSKQSAFVNVCR